MKAVRKSATERTLLVMQHDESISASSWTVPDGLTSTSADYGEDEAEIVIIGGTLGTTYQVTNTATLDSGAIAQKSVLVMVVEK